jgi:hypothetical protein
MRVLTLQSDLNSIKLDSFASLPHLCSTVPFDRLSLPRLPVLVFVPDAVALKVGFPLKHPL